MTHDLHLYAPSVLSLLLLCLRWYHGHLPGANAEKLLVARDEPDTFLVRESMSKPGDFVLSVLTNEKSKTGSRRVSHIKIMCQVFTQTQTLTPTFVLYYFSVCDHTCGAQLCDNTYGVLILLLSDVAFLNCWASPTVLLTRLSSFCSA